MQYIKKMEKKDDKTKNNNNNIKLNLDSDAFIEQVNMIRNQIQNAKTIWQNKTYNAIDTAKTRFLELTKKIESDIANIKNNVVELENELLEIQNNVSDHNITFLQEVLRKFIHLCSLSIPICYIFFTKENILMILIPLMLLTIITDISTKRNPFLRTQYLKIFGFMLRKHEIETKEILLNGASWVMIASVLTIYFFPQIIAIVGMTVLFISDVVAAIVGRRFGKKRFLELKNKSWIGTITFFISASLVASIYGIIFNFSFPYFVISIFASLVAAFCEAISAEVLHTDDNLTIPISFGITMWVGSAFLNYFFQINLF